MCVGVEQRPYKVKVRAQDVNGETLMLTLSGWQARIFQHEYDHLQASAHKLRAYIKKKSLLQHVVALLTFSKAFSMSINVLTSSSLLPPKFLCNRRQCIQYSKAFC